MDEDFPPALALDLLLTPSLREVKIESDQRSSYHQIELICQRLLDVAPRLRELDLFQESPSQLIDLSSFVVGGFNALQQLVILRVSDIGFAGWESLEGCPNLQEIEVHYWGMDWSVVGEGPVVLSALHTLRFVWRFQNYNAGTGTSFHDRYMSAIMMQTIMPSLRTLHFEASMEMRSMFKHLQQNSPLLKELRYFHSADDTSDVVDLLSPFSQLVTLAMTPTSGCDRPFDDVLIEDMVCGLPALRSLSVTHHGPGIPLNVTDQVLIDIARHSTVLEELRIEIDASGFAPPATTLDPYPSLRSSQPGQGRCSTFRSLSRRPLPKCCPPVVLGCEE